jgi:acetyl-CoA carboxylase biotin carboxyl carrier protein
MLSFKEIKELIDLVSEKNLSGLEIERAGFRIRIEGHRAANGAGAAAPLYFSAPPPSLPLPEPPPASILTTGEPGRGEESVPLHMIVSPIVGTFYRSPSPESAPFVSVGEVVQKGKILCIIEAMKLMNEIESDVSGEVVEVFCQNGQPVEYGERLFAIRLA